MRFFYAVAIFFVFDFLWWLMADRLARRTASPRGWRRFVAVVAGVAAGGLALLLIARLLRMKAMIMPEEAVIAVFLWHFLLVLPATLVAAVAVLLGRRRDMATIELPGEESPGVPAPVAVNFSRRDLLYRGIIVLPPVALAGLSVQSKYAEDHLIRRDLDVPIRNLPPALEGLTIAHVTDPHIGSFITDAKIKRIIDMTNEMDADLVLQTGDLINQSLTDLPDGIEMLRKFRGRYGVFSCQGNHDIIDNQEAFEQQMEASGLNILLDTSHRLDIRGQRVCLVAPRWWGATDAALAESVNRVAGFRPTDAFGIMLAHHPHTFDTAAVTGIGLTLSGHTHGGQIALTHNIGVGPMMYRYWSGIYQKNDSTAVVSNGTGNWFPLRINVPCEVLKLTLRRA